MATMRVNGIDVHVQRLGHESGSPRPVVVLIHGLLIDSLASAGTARPPGRRPATGWRTSSTTSTDCWTRW
jgi:hypothetical protein